MQTIKKGSKGSAVRTLQKFLHLHQDGIFGQLTDEVFRDWQRAHGLTPDGVCGPKSWEVLEKECGLGVVLKQGDAIPDNPDGSLALAYASRKVNELILHCTATKEGRDYSVADIKNWHTMPTSKGGRGWSDIGYHYVIYRDGSIHIGRDINTVGAHCTNHNTGSIGIVYVGGCPPDTTNKAKDTRTPQQKASLKRLVLQLMNMYNISKSHVRGHHEYDPSKPCPSFPVSELRAQL